MINNNGENIDKVQRIQITFGLKTDIFATNGIYTKIICFNIGNVDEKTIKTVN